MSDAVPIDDDKDVWGEQRTARVLDAAEALAEAVRRMLKDDGRHPGLTVELRYDVEAALSRYGEAGK